MLYVREKKKINICTSNQLYMVDICLFFMCVFVKKKKKRKRESGGDYFGIDEVVIDNFLIAFNVDFGLS